MFWNKQNGGNDQKTNNPDRSVQIPVTIEVLQQMVANMEDAEFVEKKITQDQNVSLLYIRTLIDLERLDESILEPLHRYSQDHDVRASIASSKILEITTLEEAQKQLLQGAVLLHDPLQNQWWAVALPNPLSRAIETSPTETIIYGPKDSFSERLDQNITLIRRRLPLTSLKSEKFTVGSLSKTNVVVMYLEGVTNPEFISIAKRKLEQIDFDQFLDSSQVSAFMEDNNNSVFPQFLQTDRPDHCAFSLGEGKIVFLVDNTPFALIAPITFFHLFQSPEDYFLRWPDASFFRVIRYFSYVLSVTLLPLYVALTTHHYQMIPLQILYVLLESRSKLPFSPFWEAFSMLIVLEVIKEASLRMPKKTGQTLGMIGGIVIGEAAVQAGFASKVLIVLVGISAIATFLIPNYQMTKSSLLIQFLFLVLASYLGIFGILLGVIFILTHLNGLTSLKQPYFAPISPFYWRDWIDLFIRGPLHLMKTRPAYLYPLQKWRSKRRR